MSTLRAEEVIRNLQLVPLEGEGGYYRQTHLVKSETEGVPETTAILFLVTPESWSGLHRLAGDEMFHFYLGDTCRMVTCDANGTVIERMLGHDLADGNEVQVNVPGGVWQGTMLAGEGEHGYALMGTTMTPGFRADQFELATEDELRQMSDDVAARLRPFLARGLPEVV